MGCRMCSFWINRNVPTFPGSDEVDQINRIHKILGTPSRDILAKLRSKSHSNRIFLEFPYQRGIGIAHLLSYVSNDCIDLLAKVLTYDSSKRITANQIMAHPYLREQ